MSIPVIVEAWQTTTPDMPGSWRRTAKAVTSVENGTRQLLRCPVLEVDPHAPYLRVVWKKNGENEWYVYRAPVLEGGKAWPPFTFTQDVVDMGVLYEEDRGTRQVVMRIPLPKKPLLQTAAPRSMEGVRGRIDAMREAVSSAGMDGDTRKTALEILSGFGKHVEPGLVELERQLQEVARVTGTPPVAVPLPTFGGVDEKGRAHFQFKSTSSVVDLYVGRDRHVEVIARGQFQLPEKGEVTPESLVGAVFVGPIGEA